jgi:hypothetical protein
VVSAHRLTGACLTVCVSWASPVRADVVVEWNAIATQAIFAAVPARPGPSAILDLAIVHAAMHDAIQSYDGRFEPYVAVIPNAAGSPIAAAASAAQHVLAVRFPPQAAALQTTLQNYLNGLGLAGNPGIVVGQQAAVGILNNRADDGSFPPNPETFVGGTGPGQWRPTPPAFAPMAAPWLGDVVPFTLFPSR